jgi:signal transduction histidine kinase
VEVEADGLGRYPQEIEAAVYFCCLEALQNVQKYAEASGAVLKLAGFDGVLAFEVSDNGKGFDPACVQRGAGLTNMTDRVQALGGSFDVSSTPGSGTRIHGSVPAVAAAVAS